MGTVMTRSTLQVGTGCPSAERREFEARCQSGALRQTTGGLAPAAIAGGLTGTVVEYCGLPVMARVIVRERSGAVVKECYTGSARAGCAGGRFEVWGLPAGSYVVEVAAPGFAPETRHGVRVEAPCVTNLGPVRLMRGDSPSISARRRWDPVAAFYPVGR